MGAVKAITREQGIKLRRIYYTPTPDWPCEFGHIAPRAVADDSCKMCNMLRFKREQCLERRRNVPPKPETKEQRLRRLNTEHVAWVKEMTTR
jgi:hypothetical protein